MLTGWSIWGEGHILSLIERSLLRGEHSLRQGAWFLAGTAIFLVMKGPVAALLQNNDRTVDVSEIRNPNSHCLRTFSRRSWRESTCLAK